MFAAQRIRVSFFDPDATDSDSGDDSSDGRHVRKAAGKGETIIVVTACTNKRSPTTHASTINKSASGPPPPLVLPRMRGAKVRPPPLLPRMRGAKVVRSRRFRGVYERQPGRWVADFRSRRHKVRRWIGTYPTEEEAKAAYDAFEKTRFSLGASVEPVALSPADWVPVDKPTRSIVLDVSDQSEVSQNHQADALSTVSSLPSPPSVAAVTPHEGLPYADERQMEDPLFAEVLAQDDIADLPLPSLDDKLDFGSADWSLLDMDAPVLCRNECNLGA